MRKATKAVLTLQDIVVHRGSFCLSIARLSVRPGQVACVVGPNGSGKTTLLLTVLGLIPYRGICQIQGAVFDGTQPEVKARIGFIPDDPELLFEEISATEQWHVTASVLADFMTGTTREMLTRHASELAQKLSFEPPPTIAKQYSHGMRKKTQIVNALIGSPALIVTDELRNGLDPIAIRQSEALIQDEKKRGAAILAATHDLWWAERFADYVYIMDRGSIVAHGTTQQLRAPADKSLEDAFFRIIEETRK